MKTTIDERRQAVSIARRMLDTNEPPILDVGECNLLCRTLLDVQEVFIIHAPIISAVKKLIKPNGEPVREFTDLYNRELVPAVIAMHRWDAKGRQ